MVNEDYLAIHLQDVGGAGRPESLDGLTDSIGGAHSVVSGIGQPAM
jgi:hypothetical protein